MGLNSMCIITSIAIVFSASKAIFPWECDIKNSLQNNVYIKGYALFRPLVRFVPGIEAGIIVLWQSL